MKTVRKTGTLLLLILCMIVWSTPVYGQYQFEGASTDVVVLGDWETGEDEWIFHTVNGAVGTAEVTTGEAYQGEASFKHTSDFSAARTATIIYKNLSTMLPLEEVSLWVKTEDFNRLNVRALDASGESFQHGAVLDPPSDWQQIVITEFASTNYWGGDGNGTFDGPVKAIEIVSPKAHLKADRLSGTVYVDLVEGKLPAEDTDPSDMMISDWENDTDGWTMHLVGGVSGSAERTTDEAYDGSGSYKVMSDYSTGGTYTLIYKNFSTPLPLEEIRLWVKTEDYSGINMRVKDASGETFQKSVLLDDTSDWQQIVIAEFTSTNYWGGDGNGTFDGAVSGVEIASPLNRLKNDRQDGMLYIDSFGGTLKFEIAANGGFESGLWMDHTPGVSLDTSEMQEGGHSVKLSGGNASIAAAAPLKARLGYELTFWSRGDNAVSDALVVTALHLDSQGKRMTAQPVEIGTISTAQGWTQHTLDLGIMSEEDGYVILAFEQGQAGDVWMDHVSLQHSNESVTVSFDETGAILDPVDAAFRVNVFTAPEASALSYTIRYEVPGSGVQFADRVMQGQPGQVVSEEHPLTGLKNGVHTLEVEVWQGERLVKSHTQPFSIMPTYVDQFGDEYTIGAVATHYALENRQDILDTELLVRSGFRYIRDGLMWHKVEKEPGVFDFSRHDWWVEQLTSAGINIIGTLNFANVLYNGMTGVSFGERYGPNSKEELDAFANYVYRTVSHYRDEIQIYELWNEPNHDSFWRPGANARDYAQLVKAAAAAIRAANPDAIIMAGSVAPQQGVEFLDTMLNEGVYPYIDAISFHPYIYPDSPDVRYKNALRSYASTLRPYGGWKDLFVTETGWPTQLDSRGVTEEVQAEYMIKHYIMSAEQGLTRSAIYDFRNDGVDAYYNEHNFGIVHYDFRAKPALIAMQQFNQTLAAAEYWAKADWGPGVEAYVWMKDQQPSVVAWSTQGAMTVQLPGETVDVYDLYGNPVAAAANQVELDQVPVYVGVSVRAAAQAVLEGLQTGYGAWTAEWAAELSGLPQVVTSVGQLSSAAVTMAGQTGLPLGAEVIAQLDLHYEQGLAVLAAVDNADLALSDAMTMLHDYYRIGRGWEHLLAIAPDAASAASVPNADASSAILSASAQIATRVQSASGGSLPYAEEVLRHAKRWHDRAAVYAAEGFTVQAAAWNHTAERLAEWTLELAAFESVEHTELLLHAYPTKLQVFEGDTVSLDISVVNGRDASFQGQIVIETDAGIVLGFAQQIALAAGDSVGLTIGGLTIQSGISALDVILNEGANRVRKQTIPVEIIPQADMELLPADKALSELIAVEVEIRNLQPDPFAGTLVVDAPEHWELEASVHEVELSDGEDKVFSIGIRQASAKPFHEYEFGLTLLNEDGDIIKQQTVLLEFTVVARTASPLKVREYDVNEWSRAYPIYLNLPSNPGSELEWQASDAAAKVYTLWDDQYFYVLVQAYDDYQANSKTGSAIWNGDSIQISFDTLNDKATSYQDDDYEYGFALTGGRIESYAWQVAAGHTPGTKPSEWANVIRDESNSLTTYAAAIPAAELEPLQLGGDDSFGFNIALNDGDVGDRDHFLEWTRGTASSKNPSYYRTWTFTDEATLPIDVPGPPTNVKVTTGDGEATISFDPPLNDGGSEILQYEVTVSPGDLQVTADSSPLTVTGLTNGITYTFSVSAVNIAGKGEPAVVSERVNSSNAALDGLSIHGGELSPPFAKSNLHYTANVPYAITEVEISVAKGDPAQTLTVTGAELLSVTDEVYRYVAQDLNVGVHPIHIVVTAQDHTENEYVIEINREADALGNNADLSELSLSAAALVPVFGPQVDTYTARVPYTVNAVTVTASVYDPRSTLEINGIQVDGVEASPTIPMQVGNNTISIVVTAEDGTVKTYTVTVVREAAPSTPPYTPPVTPPETDDEDEVSDPDEPEMYTVQSDVENGRTVSTAVIRADRLSEKQFDGKGTTEVVDIMTDADGFNLNVDGDALDILFGEQVSLELQTPIGSYKLPAGELSPERIASLLGRDRQVSQSDLELRIHISRSSDQTAEWVQDAADRDGFTLVVPPLEFEVIVTDGRETARLDTFEVFVERMIPLPEEVDPEQITTAVVMGQDGTFRPVPTKIQVVDGKAYAVIHSMTNSTYALISNPAAFADMEGHWAEQFVNSMGGRLIVNGVAEGVFTPERSITRAEFAAMLIRGLGLRPVEFEALFTDVSPDDWYGETAVAAHAFGLVNGFTDGSFRPNERITREQAMVMTANALQLTGFLSELFDSEQHSTLAAFADADRVSSWAKEGAAVSIRAGIITGRTPDELAPQAWVTRAEAAVIVKRLLQTSGLI